MKVQEIERDSNGQLPAYAWSGGYPLFYLDRENSVMCAKCATKSLDNPDEVPQFRPVTGDVYWEGDPMQCDQCNVEIESAYGPVESSE